MHVQILRDFMDTPYLPYTPELRLQVFQFTNGQYVVQQECK